MQGKLIIDPAGIQIIPKEEAERLKPTEITRDHGFPHGGCERLWRSLSGREEWIVEHRAPRLEGE